MTETNQLLGRTHPWFISTYGQTAAQKGYGYVEVWHKPIMKLNLQICRLPEVVFAPSKKEAKAFIKEQKRICWTRNVAIITLLLAILSLVVYLATAEIGVLVIGECWMAFVLGLGMLIKLSVHWKDAVITYNE